MVLLQSSMVPLGSDAPDFNLKGVDGQIHSLEDYAEAKVLVVIFMCNHCPYVHVQFVGVNANANPAYPDDSFEKMQEYVEERGQEFPYLFDETQEVAEAYDAQCTPDIFIYDEQRKLAYRGAFAGLPAAIQALLENKKPTENQEYSMGCSIKWC
jgi:peroxiredoxin